MSESQVISEETIEENFEHETRTTGRSKTFGQLVGALASAQTTFGPVTKDTVNPYYGSKYADLSQVIAATQKSLASNGLAVMQSPIVKDSERKAGVLTILAHKSGEWISNELLLPAQMKAKDGSMRFDAQSIGAAITYARRYSYQSITGVSAEQDDDGNAIAHDGNGSKAAAQAIATAKVAASKKVFISFSENRATMFLSGDWQPITNQLRANGARFNEHMGRWSLAAKCFSDIAKDCKEAGLTVSETQATLTDQLQESIENVNAAKGHPRDKVEKVEAIKSKDGKQFGKITIAGVGYSCFHESIWKKVKAGDTAEFGIVTKGRYSNIETMLNWKTANEGQIQIDQPPLEEYFETDDLPV